MLTLNDLLDDAAVQLHSTASSWEEAIREAGGLLEKTGAISSEYTQAMIASVHDNGPYIVVAPGFAFAHARPSEAVHRTAVSWLRLDRPVRFGHKTNDPVNLVVALAAADDSAHTSAMQQLARILGNKQARADLDQAESVAQVRAVLEAVAKPKTKKTQPVAATQAAPTAAAASDTVASKGKIFTVCGNGLGTSLFLKNTVEKVLDAWGWTQYLDVEATDTISAKGKAKDADFLLTSGEIGRTLGDVGVPVYIIEDFTSAAEVDTALRTLYDV